MANFKIVETKIPKRVTVSGAAGMVNQPEGGYIDFKDFHEDSFEDDTMISGGSKENIFASTVGLTVDYLTRYLLTNSKEEAFDMPYKGFEILKQYAIIKGMQIKVIHKLGLENDPEFEYSSLDEEIASTNWDKIYNKLLSRLDLELSDKYISAAVKLACFDVAYRSSPEYFTGIRHITPDSVTIDHIRCLIQRTLAMLQSYGPLISTGFNFPEAYTENIVNGDADYLTENTLWDLKVINDHFNQAHVMQLLLYWRFGMKSNPKQFSKTKFIGILSPRQNKAYRYDLSQIPKEFIDFLDYEIIGYKKD